MHGPEVDFDLSFDHDEDFTHDWISNIRNDPQHKTTQDSFLPELEQTSFMHPAGESQISNQMGNKTPAESPQDGNQGDPGCSCTAQSLAIIPELQQYSTRRMELSFDEVLRLTRRGTSAISNHLDCHNTRSNSSRTSLLSCILVLMQVAACYTFLRKSVGDPACQKQLPVSVGGLNIEDDETRRHMVNVLLDAEIRKSVILNSRLEEWGLQLQMASNTLPCEPLLSSIRQELERA